MVDDWSGNQLRIEGDEGRKTPKAAEGRLRLRNINQIGDFLEREKTDAQWKNNVDSMNVEREKVVYVIYEEIGVFEVGKHTQIQNDPRAQCRFTEIRIAPCINNAREKVIYNGQGCKNCEVPKFPTGVKGD